MFKYPESTAENTTAARGSRKLLSGLLRPFRSTANQRANSEHLSPRRSFRLAALLAPGNRWKTGGGLAVVVLLGALLSAALFPPAEDQPLNNAIWLDRNWVFGKADALDDLAARMTENGIGKAYAYVSSLGSGERWQSGAQGESGFMDARADIAEFVETLKSKNEEFTLYAWLEIWTNLDDSDGYRLDEQNLHQDIAEFCRLLIEQLGFDGLLLDAKPLFSDDDNFIRLIRRVRSAVGLDKPIAVAVTADLTPHNLRQQAVPSIAPGTMWSPDFKKRIMVSADEVVLTLYQSYRQDASDYIDWVAYHVESYITLLETNTAIYVSIPNYASAGAGHDAAIENMDSALAGLRKGLRQLEPAQQELLTGVAIFSDTPLSQADWAIFRENLLQRA